MRAWGGARDKGRESGACGERDVGAREGNLHAALPMLDLRLPSHRHPLDDCNVRDFGQQQTNVGAHRRLLGHMRLFIGGRYASSTHM